jgi:hypothetical protein
LLKLIDFHEFDAHNGKTFLATFFQLNHVIDALIDQNINRLVSDSLCFQKSWELITTELELCDCVLQFLNRFIKLLDCSGHSITQVIVFPVI